MEVNKLEKSLHDLLEEVKNLKEDLKSTKIKTLKGIYEFIVFIVRFIEKLSKDQEIKKADKKVLAVGLLNYFIDIPWVPEAVEGRLLDMLVDLTVEVFNQTFGKMWIEKLQN